MRRLLPLIILLPLVLGLLGQPGGTSAAPPAQPPAGECWGYFQGGTPGAGGLISLVLHVNQMGAACEYNASLGGVPTFLDAFSVESFVVPDQGASCAIGFVYGSTTWQGASPPTYSSGNLGRVALPDPIRIRLQPDFSRDGCGGPNYTAKLTLALFQQPAGTATATSGATSTPTPDGSTSGTLGPQEEWVGTFSGKDAWSFRCYNSGSNFLTMSVQVGSGAVQQANLGASFCDQLPGPWLAVRADGDTVTVRVKNNHTEAGRIYPFTAFWRGYNDIALSRNAGQTGTLVYDGNHALEFFQRVNLTVSGAGQLQALCSESNATGAAVAQTVGANAATYCPGGGADPPFWGPYSTADPVLVRWDFNVLGRWSQYGYGVSTTVHARVELVAAATPQPSWTTIPSPTRTRTTTASAVQARTPTSSPTRTSTAPTSTPTPTITGTLPVAGDCAVGTTYGVPVAPATVVLTLTVGLRFTVADQPVVFNIGSQAQTIAPGSYQWEQQAGAYTVYSLTTPARVKLCIATAGTPTIGTPTQLPTYAPGEEPCVPATPIPADIPGTYPDLALILPSWTPAVTVTISITATATLTATPGISLTAIVALIGTASTGIISPAQAIETAVAPYSWAAGETTAASWLTTIQPALDWLAIINPLNPSWDIEGGPLWALAPLIKPILPIIAISVLVALAGFLLWIVRLLLALFDIILKLIEAVTP